MGRGWVVVKTGLHGDFISQKPRFDSEPGYFPVSPDDNPHHEKNQQYTVRAKAGELKTRKSQHTSWYRWNRYFFFLLFFFFFAAAPLTP